MFNVCLGLRDIFKSKVSDLLIDDMSMVGARVLTIDGDDSIGSLMWACTRMAS